MNLFSYFGKILSSELTSELKRKKEVWPRNLHFPNVRMRLDDGRYFLPTQIAGISCYQNAVANIHDGQTLALVREPQHPKDSNAIMVFAGGEQIGYIPRKFNEYFAIEMDNGHDIEADIHKVVGGTPRKPTIGCRINLYFPLDAPLEFD